MSMTPHELASVGTHCVVCGNPVPTERAKTKSITCSEDHAKARKARLRMGDRSCKCVVCTKNLTSDRTRYSSITCCSEHGAIRKASIRARVDMKRCRQCRKPSTPIERAAYKRFRSIELTRPDLLYPAAFKRWAGDAASFAAALEASFIAKEAAGDDSPSEFDLELVDRRSKDSPGGARSGRPKLVCECGDTKAEHKPKTKKNPNQPCEVLECLDCQMFRPKGAEHETHA